MVVRRGESEAAKQFSVARSTVFVYPDGPQDHVPSKLGPMAGRKTLKSHYVLMFERSQLSHGKSGEAAARQLILNLRRAHSYPAANLNRQTHSVLKYPG